MNAAAPEMLEALKAITTAISKDNMDKCYAAIAKAEGKDEKRHTHLLRARDGVMPERL